MAKFRMNKCEDIRRTLQRVSDMVAEGTLDSKQANTIIYACQTALSVKKIELLVQEKNAEISSNNSLNFDFFNKELLDI